VNPFRKVESLRENPSPDIDSYSASESVYFLANGAGQRLIYVTNKVEMSEALNHEASELLDHIANS